MRLYFFDKIHSRCSSVASGAVFIDSIKLDTTAGAFTATEVPVSAPESTISVTAPGAPPIDDLLVLKPGASRQMLYRLRQKVPDARVPSGCPVCVCVFVRTCASNSFERFTAGVVQSVYCKLTHSPHAQNATQVGTVAVTWRAALGESASFVSDVLERKAVSRDEVELIVRRVPPTVRIEEPFAVEGTLGRTHETGTDRSRRRHRDRHANIVQTHSTYASCCHGDIAALQRD